MGLTIFTLFLAPYLCSLCLTSFMDVCHLNNLLMGSGSQIIAPAEEQRADKGEFLAYEPERQRAV